jgi:hypothetical protein
MRLVIIFSVLFLFSYSHLNSQNEGIPMYEPESRMDSLSIYKIADFPEGYDKELEFISKNIQYPREALKAGLKGDVVILFDIDTTGKLSNFSVLTEGLTTDKSVIEIKTQNGKIQKVDASNENLEPIKQLMRKEALRIVSIMPNWTPAELRNGQKVKSDTGVNVNFYLPKKH